MNVILDTQVLIAGIFFDGHAYQILKAWRDGRVQLVLSREIFDEYHRAGDALAEQFPVIDLSPILAMIREKAETSSVQCLLAPLNDKPETDKFVACALTGTSKIIVSRDRCLLKESDLRNVQVLHPREFVDLYLRPIRANQRTAHEQPVREDCGD